MRSENGIIITELKKLEKNRSQFFVLNINSLNQSVGEILSHLLETRNLSGVHVVMNKNIIEIVEFYDRGKISRKKVYFIVKDSVPLREENAMSVAQPASLVEVSLIINNLINSGKYKFVFFEFMPSLLSYYDANLVEKFAHHLIQTTTVRDLFFVGSCCDCEQNSRLLPLMNQDWQKITLV